MRYGPDDPTLWPQQYSEEFCHLGAIPRRPVTSKAKATMWWDPDQNDFISPQSGQTITRGLGKLTQNQCSQLAQSVELLLKECAVYTETTRPAKIPPIITQLSDSVRLGLERLNHLPSTYTRMVIEVTNLQRCCLELMGVLRYRMVYKPRIMAGTAEEGLPDDCMGVFTSDPVLAQQFHVARLPYWLIRPLTAFHTENILEVVKPLEAAGTIELDAAPSFIPVSVGGTIEQRLRSLHLCTKVAPWYKDPFLALPPPPPATLASPPSQPVAGSSHSRLPSTYSRGRSHGVGAIRGQIRSSPCKRSFFVGFCALLIENRQSPKGSNTRPRVRAR